MMAVAYSDHRNSGMRNQVMPFGRMVWTVAMKLIPVKIELNPRMKTPSVAVITLEFVVVL
jgi:hypothetical protein